MSDRPGIFDGNREKQSPDFSFQSEKLPELNNCLLVETEDCHPEIKRNTPAGKGLYSFGNSGQDNDSSTSKVLRERLNSLAPVSREPVHEKPERKRQPEKPEPVPETPDLSSLTTLSISDDPLSGTYAIDEVHDFMRNNFKWFDKNRDKKIGDEEYSSGLEALKAYPEAERMVNTLSTFTISIDFKNKSFDEIARNHRNERSLYREYRQRQKESVPDYYDMTNLGLRRFSEIDQDQNNQLSRHELRAARDNTKTDSERKLFDGLIDNYRYVAYGPVGLPRGRFGSYQNYIDRDKLFEFVEQGYGWKYESEHGIWANLKRAKNEFDKGTLSLRGSEKVSREYLYGEVQAGKKWWQLW